MGYMQAGAWNTPIARRLRARRRMLCPLNAVVYPPSSLRTSVEHPAPRARPIQRLRNIARVNLVVRQCLKRIKLGPLLVSQAQISLGHKPSSHASPRPVRSCHRSTEDELWAILKQPPRETARPCPPPWPGTTAGSSPAPPHHPPDSSTSVRPRPPPPRRPRPRIPHCVGLERKPRWRPANRHFAPTIGDAQRLPFPNDTFDCVVENESLEWIKNPVRYLKEAARVCTPDGLVITDDSDWDTLVYAVQDTARARRILRTFCDTGPNGWIGRTAPTLMRQAGLRHIQVHVRVITEREFAPNTLGYHQPRSSTTGSAKPATSPPPSSTTFKPTSTTPPPAATTSSPSTATSASPTPAFNQPPTANHPLNTVAAAVDPPTTSQSAAQSVQGKTQQQTTPEPTTHPSAPADPSCPPHSPSSTKRHRRQEEHEEQRPWNRHPPAHRL